MTTIAENAQPEIADVISNLQNLIKAIQHNSAIELPKIAPPVNNEAKLSPNWLSVNGLANHIYILNALIDEHNLAATTGTQAEPRVTGGVLATIIAGDSIKQ